MTTINFGKIWAFREIRYTCIGCGKKRTKKVRMYNTVNPFNKNADGSVKTPREISADLKKSIEEKVKAFRNVCSKCQLKELEAQR